MKSIRLFVLLVTCLSVLASLLLISSCIGPSLTPATPIPRPTPVAKPTPSTTAPEVPSTAQTQSAQPSPQEKLVVGPLLLTVQTPGLVDYLDTVAVFNDKPAILYAVERRDNQRLYLTHQETDGNWETQYVKEVPPLGSFRQVIISQLEKLSIFRNDDTYTSSGFSGGGIVESHWTSKGGWSNPLSILKEPTDEMDAVFLPSGKVAAIWDDFPKNGRHDKLYYVQEESTGVWSAPTQVLVGRDFATPKIIVKDGLPAIILLLVNQRDNNFPNQCTAGEIAIIRRDVNGNWQSPTTLFSVSGEQASVDQRSDGGIQPVFRDSKLHIFLTPFTQDRLLSLYEAYETDQGNWQSPVLIATEVYSAAQILNESGVPLTVLWAHSDRSRSNGNIQFSQKGQFGWSEPKVLLKPSSDRLILQFRMNTTTKQANLFWDELQSGIPKSDVKYAVVSKDMRVLFQTTVPICPASASLPLALMSDHGEVHVVWGQGRGEAIAYAKIKEGAIVSKAYPVDPSGDLYSVGSIALDKTGKLHLADVVKPGAYSTLRYAKPNEDGSWSIELAFVAEPPTYYWLAYPNMAVADDGTVHIIFHNMRQDRGDDILYVKRSNDGVWSEPEILASLPGPFTVPSNEIYTTNFSEIDGQLTVSWYQGTKKLGTSRLRPKISRAYGIAETSIRLKDGMDNEHVIWTEISPLGYSDIWYKVVRMVR